MGEFLFSNHVGLDEVLNAVSAFRKAQILDKNYNYWRKNLGDLSCSLVFRIKLQKKKRRAS